MMLVGLATGILIGLIVLAVQAKEAARKAEARDDSQKAA
jgi:hypothetical protein